MLQATLRHAQSGVEEYRRTYTSQQHVGLGPAKRRPNASPDRRLQLFVPMMHRNFLPMPACFKTSLAV